MEHLASFMPHGQCYLWTPLILWTHVGSDALVALSYYSIPVALAVLIHKRDELPFSAVFAMFGAFIFMCGTTHLMNIWTTWHPDYLLQGWIKAATAAVSVATAIAVWPLLPRMLTLPSPAQLRDANDSLREEVAKRQAAEIELREANAVLARTAADLEQRTRDLERSNVSLSRFAYVASHDLREPLRSVASFCGLLEERYGEGLDERGRKWLGFARRDAMRMQELVDDLLAYARVQTAEVAREPVDLGALAHSVAQSLSTLIAESQARVEIGALATVPGDESMLRQLLQNLITNAIRHGGTRVVLEARESEDGALIVSTSDDGPGIDPKYHARIFEPFQRLERHRQGSGMGLTICREVVERHGGRIWVESGAEGGARFYFSLPGR